MKLFCTILIMIILVGCSRNNSSATKAGDNVKPINDFSTAMGESVFSLGNGFDELKRSTMSSMCLDAEVLNVQYDRINLLDSRSEIIQGHHELMKKLDVNVDVGVSGVYKFITGDISASANFVKQTNVSSDTLMVVVEYNYIDNKKMIFTQIPELVSELEGVSLTEFRRQCGDKYMSEISVGARLFYVFSAEYHETNTHSKSDIETAIKIGFAKLFMILNIPLIALILYAFNFRNRKFFFDSHPVGKLFFQ